MPKPGLVEERHVHARTTLRRRSTSNGNNNKKRGILDRQPVRGTELGTKEEKKKNNNKIKYAPFARRRAQACRVSSRAVSNAPPHRRHAYAPAPTAWMCRWKVSARTPPRSESQPRRGQRISPSVREVWSIASVASSLCIHAYINIYAYGNRGIRNWGAEREEDRRTASSSSSVIEGRRRTCGGVTARVGRRWRTWLSVVSKHVRLVGVVRSVESLVGRRSPSLAPAPASSLL